MKTIIYEKLEDKKVKCGICNHFCIIESGKRGICQVRENQNGQLISLVYSKVISRAIDPIEKKPIFHLLPGSSSFSIATMGCNFKCVFCQNSSISQIPKKSNLQININSQGNNQVNSQGSNQVNSQGSNQVNSQGNNQVDNHEEIKGVDIPPKLIVEQAINYGCASISYTYTEPTIYFELALETAKLAHDKGLFNIFVTNGFMSKEIIKMVAPYLDAANVDLKAFNDNFYLKQCKAHLEPVKENLILMKSLGIMVEVTTLLIPQLNDEPSEIKAMALFIANELGVDTPWHISRFHPSYQMRDRGNTPIDTLKMAFDIGKDAGLRYVYTGNAPGLDSENTFCHSCGALLIERILYKITNHIIFDEITSDEITSDEITSHGKCPNCGTKVYGIFKQRLFKNKDLIKI